MVNIEQLYRVTFLGGFCVLLTPEEFELLQQECKEIAEYGIEQEEVEDEDTETFGEMLGRLAEFLAGPGNSTDDCPE